MRLFLASKALGEFPDRLRELVGSNKKALVISNARDYRLDDKYVDNLMAEKLKMLRDNGFETERLDLRTYFGKQDSLREFLKSYNPGLIFAIGGNVFVLRAAMKLSGFDKLLINMVESDQVVYAGNSAGAMISAETLEYYGHEGLNAQQVEPTYGVQPEMSGLKLIDSFIVPHADAEKHRQTTELYIARIKKANKKVTILKNSDVLVVDGDKTELLAT